MSIVEAKLIQQVRQQIARLPWQTHTISLLLDGININNLLHRFYTRGNTSTFEVLYLQTPFDKLYEISPCLVKLDSQTNQHLEAYLANLQNDWGYILVSDQDWQQQTSHLRNLVTAKLPNSEEQIILKIADPLLAKGLFSLSEKQQNAELFGPFSHIYTTDIIDNQHNSYTRPGKAISSLKLPFQLSEQQNAAIDEVEQKRSNHQLYLHMQEYFPTYLANSVELTPQQTVNNLIQSAQSKGYFSQMGQAYFLNLHGYLGEEVLTTYPEIASLVEQRDLDAIRQASEMAEAISLKE